MNVLKSPLFFSFAIIFGFGFNNGCSKEYTNVNSESMDNFYIDSKNGDDNNDGRTKMSPWKSLSRIEKEKILPGDTLFFKRGSSFSNELKINYSGEKNRPIVLTEYGDKTLKAASFTNSIFDPDNQNFGNCIRLKGNHIIVENLYFHKTVADIPDEGHGFLTMWQLGAVFIDKGSENCIVKNNEFFDCGVGIKSYGEFAIIKNNYIHDCNRVLKRWGWGPIGIWIGADNQEVCYNRIINYSVVHPNINWGINSYGGGADGGAIEIDDARIEKTNISIHHNYSSDCQGFLEVTWSDIVKNPKYENFSIHHNVSDDFQQFIALWRGSNCRIENNTIIRRKINENEWGVFNITQEDSKNMIRNNIIVTENNVAVFNVGRLKSAVPNSIIENNLYWTPTGDINIGLEQPGSQEIYANPHFINYNNPQDASDFYLTKSSPAIDAGLNLGYIVDFNNKMIPNGDKADIGAFEFIN